MVIMQNVRNYIIDLEPPHHKFLVQHSKILLCIHNMVFPRIYNSTCYNVIGCKWDNIKHTCLLKGLLLREYFHKSPKKILKFFNIYIIMSRFM
jgi:hypothetical protein